MQVSANLFMLFRLFFLAACIVSSTALASVIAILPPAFPASASLIDFSSLADGTEVNGLTVDGVSFAYSVAGIPADGQVVIDGGPGVTNNINPPNIVSAGDNSGTLTITLPSLVSSFGYGYAILSTGTVANATTISLFSGFTPVGFLSYTGVSDPIFTGGFAGIQSTILFDRISLTFDSDDAPAFALDNVRYATSVPEPSTTWLLLSGIVVVYWRLRSPANRSRL